MAALRRVRTSRSSNYKITGGTGIFEGASGSGTYTYRNLRTPSLAEDTKASWCCPDLNGATFRCSDVSAKVLKFTEDAHVEKMSTFEIDEHLRGCEAAPGHLSGYNHPANSPSSSRQAKDGNAAPEARADLLRSKLKSRS